MIFYIIIAPHASAQMAEASAAALAPHRFFCHSCKGEVSPKLPEYTCPRCESGFIEEVTDDSRYLSPNIIKYK
uniref:RING-type E3 ubiquitin transferase n=1 Tax=Anolis carolinensis TaxID=28377 RepID=A0A803TW38_ANOCA